LHWASIWGPVFAEISVKYITLQNQGWFVPLSILDESCGFLARCIKASVIREKVFAQMETVIFDMMFPMIFFNKDDQETLVDNPIEYIRRNEEGYGGKD